MFLDVTEISPIIENVIEEVKRFLNELNYSYIILFILLIYGIKKIPEFSWYNYLFDKLSENNFLRKLKISIAGIILFLIYSLFEYLDPDGIFDVIFVASILRSFIVIIVFNSFFINKLSNVVKNKKNKD